MRSRIGFRSELRSSASLNTKDKNPNRSKTVTITLKSSLDRAKILDLFKNIASPQNRVGRPGLVLKNFCLKILVL